MELTLLIRKINGPMHLIKMSPDNNIEELYISAEQKFNMENNDMRLVYGGKQLERSKKRLKQTHLINLSCIFAIFRMPRMLGGMKAFGTVLFNSMEKQVSLKFNQFAPSWRVVTSGLNLKGKCKNQKCPANNQIIWIQKGFGTFFINKEVQISQCPKCKVKASDITNFGYYRCKIKVDGQAQNEQPFKFEDSHRGQEDMKTFAQDNNKLIEWNYLIIQVQEL